MYKRQTFIFVFTAYLIYLTSTGWKGEDRLLFITGYYLSVGILLSLTLHLWSEEVKSRLWKTGIQLAAHALLIADAFLLYYYLATESSWIEIGIAHAAAILAVGLSTFFLSFLREKNDVASWNFALNAISSYIVTQVIGLILCAGISLLMFFSVLAVKKGFLTLLLAHIMFCIPYVMLSVTPKLRSLDPNLIDAAMDLGATPFQALTRVIVPQIRPGIVSGALIAFTMSFDDFVISYFTTGNGVNNISILVYTMSKRVNPSINALSTLVIVAITLVLGIVNLVPILHEKREKTGSEKGKSFAQSRRLMAAVAGVLVLAILGGTVGVSLSQQHKNAAAVEKYGSNVLKLYLPGEYLGENVIGDFEKQFGVRVIVENFDSNEMMYTKLMAGDKYDVVIPSDYMIERLMKENYLQPLDHSLLPNLENMDDAVRGMSYDPDNEWSVPYFWGSVGIVYNHENVDPAVVEEQGWEVLRNTDYAGHLYIYDSERDSFMMAFKALGYSMNTSVPDEINAAYEWLLQMNDTMSPVYVTDEVIDGMMNGYKDLAVVYSGDATVILDENEDMSFYMPEQGTNIWCDAMVIPANAENPLLAHEFINYMLTYEAAFDNTETVGYTSPNAEVFEEMTSSEDLYAENAAYLPRSGYEKDEMFHDNQTLMRELSKLWIKVKAAK